MPCIRDVLCVSTRQEVNCLQNPNETYGLAVITPVMYQGLYRYLMLCKLYVFDDQCMNYLKDMNVTNTWTDSIHHVL